MERGYNRSPRTANLPASGASAGALLGISGLDAATLKAIGLRLKGAAKWTLASTAAAAVTAFTDNDLHARYDAGEREFPCVGNMKANGTGNVLILWLEAETGAAVTSGVSWWQLIGSGGQDR